VNQQTWNLDRLGNLNQTSSNYGSGNRIENRQHNKLNQTLQRAGDLYAGPDATTWMPAYDGAGFLTNDGHRTMTWDGSGLLKTLTQPALSIPGSPVARPAGSWSFSYDPLRRRVTDGTTWYIYDGWRVVEERALSDLSLQKTFIYGNYLDEVLSMEARYEPAPGTPVNGYGFPIGTDAQISDGFYHAPLAKVNTLLKRYYYHTNAIYSVMALTNSTGELAEFYHYDAYGRTAVATGKGIDGTFFTSDDVVGLQSALGNPYAFTGQRLDASGLMYYKNRYYHTELGRFCSRDTLGYIDGPNSYARKFVTRYTDPEGTQITVADCIDTGEAFFNALKPSLVNSITLKSHAGNGSLLVNFTHNGKNCIAVLMCPCCQPDNEGATHTGNPGKVPSSTIAACRDNLSSTADARQAIAHEWEHSLDFCDGKLNTCEEAICSEVKSYSSSGQCDSGSMSNPQGSMTREDCVKNGAEGSAKNNCYSSTNKTLQLDSISKEK
jgi:RHS repeat-associated protein